MNMSKLASERLWGSLMHRIFHLRFNDRELVQEIYFLRQLSHDEAARKVW